MVTSTSQVLCPCPAVPETPSQCCHLFPHGGHLAGPARSPRPASQLTGSPLPQALQPLALLVHKDSNAFTSKTELVGRTCISHLLLKKKSNKTFWERVAESPLREVTWYLFSERVSFHQQLYHEDAPQGQALTGRRGFIKEGHDFLCFWEGAFHCPSEIISPQRRVV